jgi:hypothetical protein
MSRLFAHFNGGSMALGDPFLVARHTIVVDMRDKAIPVSVSVQGEADRVTVGKAGAALTKDALLNRVQLANPPAIYQTVQQVLAALDGLQLDNKGTVGRHL